MTKIPFSKPALSVEDQISKLKSRGMIFTDENSAKKILANINYYRLSGYWMDFEISRTPHQFIPNTRFEEVLSIYNFDKSLRLFLFEGISKFEVSFRTRWAYEMGTKYGPHSYLNPTYCSDLNKWIDNMKGLQSETNRSEELFLQHYRDKYIESFPPIWVSCEVFSFGKLSRWYKNLNKLPSANPSFPGIAKNDIALFYNTNSDILESWCHCLSIIRNFCAHHSRLILKRINIRPKTPDRRCLPIYTLWDNSNNGLYNLILILLYLNEQIDGNSAWRFNFISFLRSNRDYCIKYLKFPANWDLDPYWI